jgi:hypothetical protein
VHRKLLKIIIFILVALSFFGCQTPSVDSETKSPPTEISVDTLSPTISETPEPTQLLIYIDRLIGWDSVSNELAETLELMAVEKGWDLHSFTSFSEVTGEGEPVLIVVAGGNADLSDEMDRYPNAFFILVAVTGAKPAEGVGVIGPEGMRADKVAFLSGFISAMITPDWRAGVIGVGEDGEGHAAIRSFLNGAIYFCGLCRTLDPPFYDYPTSTSVASSDVSSLRSGYEQLASQAVRTIGLTHEFAADTVNTFVNESAGLGIDLIGPNPPSIDNQENWIATILPYPSGNLEKVYERLILGEEDVSLAIGFMISDVHPELLSDGKLELARSVARDLERGVIGTGVDPQTGQDR